MTNGEILEKFYKENPDMVDKVSDYRPLALDFVGDRVGITIWLKNDDIILYFPKLTDAEKRPKSLWVAQEANKLGEKNEYTQEENYVSRNL